MTGTTDDPVVPEAGSRFAVTVCTGDQQPAVTVSGEVDLANVDDFEDAMARARGDATALTVDLTGVSYCDSAAVRALFALAATTELTVIVGPTGHIATLLAISGLDRIVNVTTADVTDKG